MQQARRHDLARALAPRYAHANRREKGQLLDECCAITGCTRKHALVLLSDPPAEQRRSNRRGRLPSYGPAEVALLRVCWAATDGSCSQRLAPFLPELRHRGIDVGPTRLWPDEGLRPWSRVAQPSVRFPALSATCGGGPLRVARAFLEAWFAIWRDAAGQRRTPAEAERRHHSWRQDAEVAALPPLCKVQQRIDAEHFTRLRVFLHNPDWEATNNAAERGGRAFRHGQHPHFRLRSVKPIDADLKASACLHQERTCSPPPRRLHHCQRGRGLRAVSTPAATA